MENKEYFIEYKNNGVSGDAFVFTEKVDGLDENAIHVIEYSALASELKKQAANFNISMDQLLTEYKNVQEHLKTALEQRDLLEKKLISAKYGLSLYSGVLVQNEDQINELVADNILKHIEDIK